MKGTEVQSEAVHPMSLTVPPSLSQGLQALPRQQCGRTSDFLGGKVDNLFLGVYNMILGFLGDLVPGTQTWKTGMWASGQKRLGVP